MALLNFPDNPIPNQLYPDPCPTGVTQYRWDTAAGIWRIVGVATGVTPGTYGNSITVPQITLDVQGVVTTAANVAIRAAEVGVSGIVPLNDTTTSSSVTEALTARRGKVLQDQIGNLGVCIVPERDNVVSALNYLQLELEKVDIENLVWCGYYNALDGFISFVSAAGVQLGYQLGSELPNPEPLNSGNFFIVNVAGNPFVGGDFNAPNEECKLGNWILQDLVKWTRVNTGSDVTARDVAFDNRGSCFTATTVQTALQQTCAAFRSPVGGATIATQKPTNPYQGQLWWDNEDGYFYIYYRDGLGAQWVELGGGGSQGLGGDGGSVYEIRTGVGLSGGPITTEGTISLVAATTTQLGGVSVPQQRGLNLQKSGQLTLSPATVDTIGGIIVGDNLEITPSGVLSAVAGGSADADKVTITPINGLSTANNAQEALEDIQIEVQNRIETAVSMGAGIEIDLSLPDPNSNKGTNLKITPVRADTTKVGVVSLTNELSGTSETLALTQKAGNSLQNQIAALSGTNVLAGTYDASRGQLVYVTPAGLDKGFSVGQNCPAPSNTFGNYYVIVTVPGALTPPGATGPASSGDWYICQSGATPVWFLIDYEAASVAASSVVLSPVVGLSANNVQSGIEELQANTAKFTKTISSSAGVTVQYNGNRDCQLSITPASQFSLGGVYVSPGRGLTLGADGGLSLSVPTSSSIGGVKAGENITIEADGTINSIGGGGSGAATDVTVTPIPGIQQATNVQRALELVELQVSDRIEFARTNTSGVTISVSGPISGGYDGTTLSVDVVEASTSGRGLVQLTNDLGGQSETIAPTQKAINILNSKIESLSGSNVLAGTYNSATGTMASITPAGQSRGFVVGSQAPLAKNVPDNYYVIVVTGGGFGPIGANVPQRGVQPGDWFIVEREEGVDPAWVTIDFDPATVSAQNVAVAPIPGLAALNAQSAFTELTENLAKTFSQIGSANNGIVVTNTPAPIPGLGGIGLQSTLALQPATGQSIGGVFVAPNFGLELSAQGGLSLAPPTASTIGGVKAGTNISIDPDGTINAEAPSVGIVMLVLDDISSQFDGSKTVFVVKSGGEDLGTKGKEIGMFIEMGGVLQPPFSAYTYNPASSSLTFTSAPPAGSSFSGRVIQGVA